MAAELSGSQNPGIHAESSRSENSKEIPHEYQAFIAAVRRGDWDEAKGLLTLHPNAITAKDTWGTALHNATAFGHEQIVEELVRMMTEEQLEIKDNHGWTALARAVRENIKMVECMVTKNKKLLGIVAESHHVTPIVIAAGCEQWDIVRFLYSLTPPQDLMLDEGICGSNLVAYCLVAKQFDIAWELLQHYPRFTCTRGMSPIIAFASLSSAFPSEALLKFWQKWIYNRIRIELGHSVNDFRINVQNQENEQGNQRNNTVLGLLQGLPSRLLEFLGINRIRELKLIHVRSCKILNYMCDVIKHLTIEEIRDSGVYPALLEAVQNGIVEVVTSLCKARPELLLVMNEDGKNLLQYAVECRQEKVYSLIYGVRQRNLIMNSVDNSFNNILHCAGMLSPLASKKLDRIAGAALQMQRERQWYKEVESIHIQLLGSNKNKDGMTPPELFTKTHKKLHEEGQKWMKETASSYTVVSALIITIMFAAAFTVPGGNNQETGFPIFLNQKLFMVFIVSDAISLFSSATSVLMFLSILTSRYAEDDFLKSLPTKMIIGLSTLFISIATMMVAFSSTLFIMLWDKPCITYPIIFLAGVPVILFVWMQIPLLVDIVVSTYGGGIFDRKVKHWM
ncbi:uncharacterized protein LOC126610489 [Malus sylvestris]|uniref:uncharacterized protein LOC126610488 n=1 Tax=Malus sylvestris TaxID=3752 RepID=UPI0021AC3C7C|nr:uncharacterized protein LOC126610488 [Malus sylvestris]XP_050134533.1 uncharacterized protein LOC126610489 [Malus sylvestris]